MTEVLEYLSSPKTALKEIYRVLTNNGLAMVSTPFMNPIHGDYNFDRVRYTAVMLDELVVSVGFKVDLMKPMGSLGAVIFDTLRVGFGYSSKNGYKLISSKILGLSRPLFKCMDYMSKSQGKFINTGYFIIVRKVKI